MASFDSSSSFLIWLLAVFAALNALVSPVLAGLVIKTRFINMPTTTELPLPPGYSDQASYATSNPNDANYQIYWRVDNTNLYLFLRLKVGTTGQQTFFGNSTWMAVAFGSTMLNAQFLVVHLEKDPSGIMYSNFHEHTSIPGGVYAAPEKINGTVAQWIVQPVSASYSGTVWTAELSRALAPNDQLHWNLQSSGATDMLFAFNPGKQGEKRNFVFHDHNTDTFTTHGHLQLAFDGSLRAQSEPIPNSTMRIAHGIVMLVLWLFWFPFGVFWARYFRFVPGWVNLHVLWQIVGIFAVIVAAVLSITTINWSSPKTIINTPHYYLGFGILAIIVIQASLGLFNRSNLSSADRSEGIAKVFRWAHKTAGWLLLISAYVQMLLGLNALHPCWTQASGCSDGREEGYARWYIYLAFLIFWPVAFLSAEISMATIFNGGLLGYLKEGRMNTRGRKEFDANAITPYSKANSRHSTDDGKDESAAAFLGPNFGRPVNGRSDVEMTTFLAEKTNATGFSNQQEREMFKSRQALLENKFLEAGKKNVQLKQFTWDSLDEAVRSGKIYVVGNGKYVYDATSWVASHPGGAVILHAVAGTDITNDFFYSSFFDAADMRLPPPAQTIALSGTAQRPRHNFAANDEDPSRSLPFQSVAGNEGASDSEEGNQADYPMLSPNDWAVLTRSRRTHVHSNVAIQRLASLRVGELRVEPGLTGAALGLRPLISRTGAVHQFDPYEYRRYALTSKTILVPAALSRRSSSGGMSTSSGGSGNNQRLGGMVVKLRFCLVYPNDSRRGEPVNYLPGDVMQIQVRPTNARSSLLFIGGGANVANPDDFQTRYYTAISGCPMAFELIVKVPDKGGQVATYLAKQVPGQKQYKFRGPFGINYLARSGVPRPIGAHAPPKWVVFVSKGSGLTPFLQLLHYLFLPEHAQTRAIQSYTPADPEELPVEYGDYIVPRAHTMDGWCIAEKQAIGVYN
ncbi:hypothetical protein BJ742DRAFT_132411 [Cladochytrium replicatum]|nr:hypothetical protein BJ742DRAFT_132411 [Cladochytrium replicatum]